jgi:hypothetical protein
LASKHRVLTQNPALSGSTGSPSNLSKGQNSSPPAISQPPSAITSSEPAIPEKYKDSIENDRHFAADFADYFFGVSYRNPGDLMGYFKANVADFYADQFFATFFPPAVLENIQNKKWTLFFKRAQPARFVKADIFRDDFRVEGVLTIKSDLNSPGEVVSTQPGAILVGVIQRLKQGVCKVEKLSPGKD